MFGNQVGRRWITLRKKKGRRHFNSSVDRNSHLGKSSIIIIFRPHTPAFIISSFTLLCESSYRGSNTVSDSLQGRRTDSSRLSGGRDRRRRNAGMVNGTTSTLLDKQRLRLDWQFRSVADNNIAVSLITSTSVEPNDSSNSIIKSSKPLRILK